MNTAFAEARRARSLTISFITLALWLVTGCEHLPKDMQNSIVELGPAYKPTNLYLRDKTLPDDLRRVALLPLTTTEPAAAFTQAGAESLEPVIYSELEKSKRFEVIPITRAQMKQWTGRTQWRTDEELPPDMFQRLREGTGCDALFFCQLTRYQPYPPLAVGWKFSLVLTPAVTTTNTTPADVKGGIFWSVDEVLDSGDPAVANAARAYYSQHLRNEAPAADVSTMMNSPTRFGQYTIETLLTTMPDRFGVKK